MVPWREALARFEDYLRQAGLADNTIVNYLHDVRRFSAWIGEHSTVPVSPSTYSADEVEAYKRYLQDVQQQSVSSINRFVQSLRKFGRFQQEVGLRESNPAERVRLLESPAQSSPETLSEDAVRRLMEVARQRCAGNGLRDYAVMVLLLHAGLRVSELVQLRISDVILGDGQGFLVIHGDARRPQRHVPLDLHARNVLVEYLAELGPSTGDDRSLFVSREGSPLAPRTVQRIVALTGEAVGLEISAKTLRATYAGWLWRSTGDLALLTRRLGHSRPETALRYISPLPGTKSTTEVVEGNTLSFAGSAPPDRNQG